MTFIRKSNFAMQKNLLFLVGLWPTPSDKSRLFRVIFIYILYLSNITTQCLWLFEFDCNFNCILNVLAILMQNGIGFIKYMTFHGHIAAVQSLYVEIDLDWRFLAEDRVNLDFLLRYTTPVRLITLALMACLHFYAVSAFLIILIAPLSRQPNFNCTQFWERPVMMEEPNLQVCRPPLYILSGTLYVNVAILLTAESTFMVFSEHVCVMLKMAGYHLRHATLQNVYPKTLLAVRTHMRALKFLKTIWNIFSPSYMLLIFFGMVSASTSVMSLRVSVLAWEDIRVIFISFSYVLVISLYGCISTYFGQRLIDHSSAVFHDAYNSKWYEFPVNAQKFYFIVMERSIKSCSYAKPGFFVSSLEGLTSLMSATFSYVAVFVSVQN